MLHAVSSTAGSSTGAAHPPTAKLIANKVTSNSFILLSSVKCAVFLTDAELNVDVSYIGVPAANGDKGYLTIDFEK